MKRLTTDEPQGNYDGMLNMAFAKNKEVYLRGAGEYGKDISLVDYTKQVCKEHCGVDLSGIPVQEFSEYMDDCDCSIPVLHFLAIGAAELRARLSQYEDLGLEPKQIATLKDTTNELLNHLDKTYESERQLKVKVLKALEGMG